MGIAAGNIGIARLKPPAAGEPPDIVPHTGARYWEYMQSVVKKHCPGWKLVSRNIGLVLEEDIYRDRTQEFH